MPQSFFAVTSHDEIAQEAQILQRQDFSDVDERLQESFDCDFALFDGSTGECLRSSFLSETGNWDLLTESIREVGRRGRAEFIWENEPIVLLAIPLNQCFEIPLVAVGIFSTVEIASQVSLEARTSELDLDLHETAEQLKRQQPIPAEVLLKMANGVVRQISADARITALEDETSQLAEEIATTYEEITLLHRLTHNLKLSSSISQLGEESLKWLDEVIQAEGFALQIVSREDTPHDDKAPEAITRFITRGDVPVDSEGITRMVAHFGLAINQRPLVLNHVMTQACCEQFPGVRELVAVPLTEGEKLFGWLAVFNHETGGEFGTVEANLLSTVATILGIHSGNIELYRQQSELLAGIVKALTSAIDAKDPYTCGHSDRVARVAVRLGQELGYDEATLKTIYMAGLLHDVGKIGISDEVLGKDGPLTPEEFEHIKTHVEIGYRILVDLKQLGEVLPLVRHHHESWDGSGYPHQLAGEEIPELARLAAVADAFDAMSSDRPYRPGMDDEKIDAIFRNGSGKQWDPQVVEAFFKIRDEIREISGSNSDHNVLAI